jgi:hypothetical protein
MENSSEIFYAKLISKEFWSIKLMNITKLKFTNEN